MAHTYNPSIGEVRQKDGRVQGHPQLQVKIRPAWGPLDPFSRKKKSKLTRNKELTIHTICPGINLQWFSTYRSPSLWGSDDPFTGVTYLISWTSDIYITIHNSGKTTDMKKQWNNFMVGGSPQHETVLKDHIRKVENHWVRASFGKLLIPGSKYQCMIHYIVYHQPHFKEVNINYAVYWPRSHNKSKKSCSYTHLLVKGKKSASSETCLCRSIVPYK